MRKFRTFKSLNLQVYGGLLRKKKKEHVGLLFKIFNPKFILTSVGENEIPNHFFRKNNNFYFYHSHDSHP